MMMIGFSCSKEGGEIFDPGGANLSLSTRGSIERGSRHDCNPWHKEEDILFYIFKMKNVLKNRGSETGEKQRIFFLS
jgi:hypothetical protein